MCQLDSWSKIIYRPDGRPISVDWIKVDENRTFRHEMSPERHATVAIAEEAEAVMARHSSDLDASTKPLFLYAAMTAAHSPLQPLPEHEAQCTHHTHPWRRGFCGMVVGADEAVKNMSTGAVQYLGSNTIFVVTSDNGGSPWFGGNNWPLRGGKTSPFEGGVRVPAFVIDFTDDGDGGQYLGRGDRWFMGMAHITDWLPTMLGWAGGSAPEGLDGFDLGPALRIDNYDAQSHSLGPRQEVLLDMYAAGEAIWEGEGVVALRVGKYKLVQGSAHEPHWYAFDDDNADETSQDSQLLLHNLIPTTLKTSDQLWVSLIGEVIVRLLEPLMGVSLFDTLKTVIVFNQVHSRHIQRSGSMLITETFLFDLETDPEENNNLAKYFPSVVKALERRAAEIRDRRPPQSKYWMVVERFRDTLVPGNCSRMDGTPAVAESDCLFAHPWIADDANLDAVPLQHTVVVARRLIKDMLGRMARASLLNACAVVGPLFLLCGYARRFSPY